MAWIKFSAGIRRKKATYNLNAKVLSFRILWVIFVLREAPSWFLCPEEGEFYLSSMAIYPQFKGMGLERIMLDHIEKEARKKKCRALSLDVNTRNNIAIEFYKKQGFIIEKRIQI